MATVNFTVAISLQVDGTKSMIKIPQWLSAQKGEKSLGMG
jgi:hypothetical protein